MSANSSFGQIQCSGHFETSTRIWQKTKKDSEGIHFKLVYPEKVPESSARLFNTGSNGGKCMMCGIYPAFYLLLTPHHSHHTSIVCKEGCASLLYDFIKTLQGEEAANALKALHNGESPDVHAPEKVIQMFGDMDKKQKHEIAELYYRMQMKAKKKNKETNESQETEEEVEAVAEVVSEPNQVGLTQTIPKVAKKQNNSTKKKTSFAFSLSRAFKKKSKP